MENEHKASYAGSLVILAEIESMRDKAQARFKAGLITEQQLIECMRELGLQEHFQYNLQYENSEEDDLRRLATNLSKKCKSLKHGHAVERGKTMARLRRQLNCSPTRLGAA